MQGRKTNILQELEQAIKKKAFDRQLSRESAKYFPRLAKQSRTLA